VAHTVATGGNTGVPNPPAITPSTAGSWIVVAGAGSSSSNVNNPFTNPGDLSATTNHFKSAWFDDTNEAVAGIGIKTDWAAGAFDPAQWTGGHADAANAWCAVTMALRPA
jgi:hypothetical protein